MLMLAVRIILAIVALGMAVAAARWEPHSRRRRLAIAGAVFAFLAFVVAQYSSFHESRDLDRRLAATSKELKAARERAAELTTAQRKMEEEVAASHAELAAAKRKVAELVAARQPRILTEEQRRIILRMLKDKTPTTLIVVSAFTGEPDSMAFADELRSALTAAGWKSEGSIGLHFQTTRRGLNIDVPDEAVPGAVDLMSALREARLDPHLVAHPNSPRRDIISISVDAR